MYSKNCPQCGKIQTYSIKQSLAQAIKQNRVCKSCSNRSRKLSAEARKNMSEAAKGRKHSIETRKKISDLHKGKVISTETRKKISLSRHRMFGTNPDREKHNRDTMDYRAWRQDVLRVDNYKCQYCHRKDSLHVHHIFSMAKWPKLIHNTNNGITLCQPCHIDHHRVNGI